jgi:hypothetical protein
VVASVFSLIIKLRGFTSGQLRNFLFFFDSNVKFDCGKFNMIKPSIYSWVIGDVVEKMNQKFTEMGLDETILTELQQVLLFHAELGRKGQII